MRAEWCCVDGSGVSVAGGVVVVEESGDKLDRRSLGKAEGGSSRRANGQGRAELLFNGAAKHRTLAAQGQT